LPSIGEKRETNGALDGQNARTQFQRQVAAEQRHRAAVDGENEDPEQHGAFVVSPYAGNFIKQWLGRMGILKHVLHGEIGDQIGMGERGKGHVDKYELDEGCRNSGGNHLAIPACRAHQRHESLVGGNGERQY